MTLFRSRFGGLYVFGLVFLAVSALLRVALFVACFAQVDTGVWVLAKTALAGLLFDLVTYLYLTVPVVLFLLLVPDKIFRWRGHRLAAVAVYFVALCVMLFDATAEWCFWDEFESRFNFVAVDYLVYTQEVTANAWQSYPVVPVLVGIGVAALAIVLLTRRAFLRAFESESTFRRRLVPAAVCLGAAGLAAFFVDLSSLDRLSPNRYNNELAGNGFYSFFAALHNNVINYEDFYLTVPEADAFSRLKTLLREEHSRDVGTGPLDITRDIRHPGEERRANVVLVVVESLSAKYLGLLGNPDGLTPNLDALGRESLVFRRLYATGTRTDRGLEALTLSLPPTPGRSVVKRPHNENLFSIGPLFRSRGYDTKFIYSGYSTFDNMNTFFEGNGFETVDGAGFAKEEVTFSNAWGVCDGDLYRRVIRECDRSHAAGKRFLSLVLTTSNHRPFTFPPSFDAHEWKGRSAGVHYSDQAIGEFLQAARRKPWFDDTVFLFVADHCSSSAGRTEVPVSQYHIPLLIYGPKIVPPGSVDTVASQMDVAPTLLGLLNFSYRSRFFGRDLLSPGPGRALLGNYEKLGLYQDGKLLLLLPRGKSSAYDVDAQGAQTPAPPDANLRLDAVSYYQSAAYLLRNHLYQPD